MKKRYLSVELPMARLDRPVSKFTLHQRDGHHDIAKFHVNLERHDQAKFKTGQPVRVRWATSSKPAEFIGYINHATGLSDTKKYTATEVLAVGASFWMKSPRHMVWRGVTIPDIARRLAREHRLRALIDPHPHRWPQLIQAGESDWSFLAKQADRIGYALYCNGTELRLLDRDRVLSPALLGKPPIKIGPTSVHTHRGAEAPVHGRRRSHAVSGMDWKTVAPYKVKTAEPAALFDAPIAVAADDFSQGHSALKSADRKANFDDALDIEVLGDARIHQGSVVELNAEKTPGFPGIWFVNEVEHRLASNFYRMTVRGDLIRGSAPPRSLPDNRNPSPGSRLVGDRWVSAGSS